MKALVYTALKTMELREVPEPTLAEGEVKVKVSATGICGSDVHGFLGHSARRLPGLILGHETMGVVAEGDAAIEGQRVSVNPLISCGECPACRAGRQNCCPTWRLLGMDQTHGGFADYIVVPRRNVHLLPDSVSDAAAVMVEPLANAFHILSMIPKTAGLLPTVAILGGGTLGACILSVAKVRGLQVIALSEPNPLRAAVAEKLGATTVLDPLQTDVVAWVREATKNQGVSASIDAVGNSITRTVATSIVERGGTALFLGLDQGPTSFDFFDLIRREVRIQTSYAYSESDFAAALDFVIRGQVDFSPWTDVIGLGDGQGAFERLTQNPGDRLKVTLIP